MKGGRTGRAAQPNVLRKRSAAGNNLQATQNPSFHSIEHASPAYPSQTDVAGLHVTITHSKDITKVEAAEQWPCRDSGIDMDNIYAAGRDYQESISGPRVSNKHQTETSLSRSVNALTDSLIEDHGERKEVRGRECRSDPVDMPKRSSLGMSASFVASLPLPFDDRHSATRSIAFSSEACLDNASPGTLCQNMKR